MAEVLALVEDMIFRAKIQETARHAGVAVEFKATATALAELSRGAQAGGETSQDSAPRLVLLDLNTPPAAQAAALDAVTALRAAGNAIPVIAFLSHVQTALAERARAAGCSEAMPRSKFTAQLAEILSRAKA